MYFNDETIVYLDGQWVRSNDAQASVYVQSLHYGMSVFEGIRSYETERGIQIFRGQEHYERLMYSAGVIGLQVQEDAQTLLNISYELLERNKMQEAYIRPMVFGGPMMSLHFPTSVHLMICCWPWEKLLGENLARLGVSSVRRPDPRSCKIEAKIGGHYVNSILAASDARSRGYDDALQLDVEGNIAECSGANFFYEKNNTLYTASPGHILPGLTRNTIFQLCDQLQIELIEQEVQPEEVMQADGAFLVGTAAEVTGIRSVDQYVFPKAWKDSKGYMLQQAYGDATKSLHAWNEVVYR